MDAGIKAHWLTALRSGDFKQGKGYLKSETSGSPMYCCLGVLCELAVKAGVIEKSELDVEACVHSFSSKHPGIGISISTSSSYLPQGVADWAGIHYQGKIYHEHVNSDEQHDLVRVRVDLADLNDHKLDFAGIANVIEKEF